MHKGFLMIPCVLSNQCASTDEHVHQENYYSHLLTLNTKCVTTCIGNPLQVWVHKGFLMAYQSVASSLLELAEEVMEGAPRPVPLNPSSVVPAGFGLPQHLPKPHMP